MNVRPRQLIAGLAAVAAAVAVAACSGSSINPRTDPAEIVVGFILPQTGPYKAIGDDEKIGWDLYLNQHGGKLGGHPVRVVTADEGDGGPTARAAVDKLLKQDHAAVIVGTATAPAVSTVAGAVTEARVPFVGVGGRPTTLSDLRYIWHTSFVSTDHGRAIASHLRSTVDGPVYVIGPDYQGGRDQIGGFVEAYTAAGGRLAGGQPNWTPWPATTNFGPWLSQVKGSGAKAVYTFYAGAPAVAFVKQYQQFGLHTTVPLYAAGFLTEGAALRAEGAAADGIRTVANYSPDLNNPTNTAFVAALRAAHPDLTPNLYHVTSYDAAAVLDRAIAAAGANPTSEAINTAIGRLGDLDSPRGQWRIGPAQHSPIQRWYLRQVTIVAGTRTNTVVAELATLGT